jgi:hypothetical protein
MIVRHLHPTSDVHYPYFQNVLIDARIARSSEECATHAFNTPTSTTQSDDSVLESPAPAQLTGGTARTRGMRGAAFSAFLNQ